MLAWSHFQRAQHDLPARTAASRGAGSSHQDHVPVCPGCQPTWLARWRSRPGLFSWTESVYPAASPLQSHGQDSNPPSTVWKPSKLPSSWQLPVRASTRGHLASSPHDRSDRDRRSPHAPIGRRASATRAPKRWTTRHRPGSRPRSRALRVVPAPRWNRDHGRPALSPPDGGRLGRVRVLCGSGLTRERQCT